MKKKTHDEFAKEVLHFRGDTIEFLSEYVNAKTKVNIRCKKCGREYAADPRQLVKAKVDGCKYCGYVNAGKQHGVLGGKTKKYDYQSAKSIIEEDGSYSLLSDTFDTVVSKLKVLHIKCGNEFEVTLDHFRHGTRCPYCSRNPIIDTNIYKKRLLERTNGEFQLVGDYISAKTPVDVFHKKCNHVVQILPDVFNRHAYCPYCSKSKGEQEIENYLLNNNIRFESEYSFPDLKSKSGNPLRFDFAIWLNKKLCLVEYDGEFHFKKYYEEQNYETLVEHDEMKNIYTFEHNIPLLRIPFTDFPQIENRMEAFITKYA